MKIIETEEFSVIRVFLSVLKNRKDDVFSLRGSASWREIDFQSNAARNSAGWRRWGVSLPRNRCPSRHRQPGSCTRMASARLCSRGAAMVSAMAPAISGWRRERSWLKLQQRTGDRRMVRPGMASNNEWQTSQPGALHTSRRTILPS